MTRLISARITITIVDNSKYITVVLDLERLFEVTFYWLNIYSYVELRKNYTKLGKCYVVINTRTTRNQTFELSMLCIISISNCQPLQMICGWFYVSHKSH